MDTPGFWHSTKAALGPNALQCFGRKGNLFVTFPHQTPGSQPYLWLEPPWVSDKRGESTFSHEQPTQVEISSAQEADVQVHWPLRVLNRHILWTGPSSGYLMMVVLSCRDLGKVTCSCGEQGYYRRGTVMASDRAGGGRIRHRVAREQDLRVTSYELCK